MKVLGIVGSPRKNGNTEILVKKALDSARRFGAETEIVSVSNKNIRPCEGCDSCSTTGKCKIDDDMQDIYTKLVESDGIIFGSPVYFWGITAQAKAIIDRTHPFSKKRELRNKVAGAVIVAGGGGASFAFSSLNAFFNLQRMIPARSIGPRTEDELLTERSMVIAYADKRGTVKENKRAMSQAQALGRAIVETIHVLNKGEGIIPMT